MRGLCLLSLSRVKRESFLILFYKLIIIFERLHLDRFYSKGSLKWRKGGCVLNIINFIFVAVTIMICPLLLGCIKLTGNLKKHAITDRISIIIPAYNDAAHLRKLLPALFAQLEDMVQIIVVDQGSTDNTTAVVHGCGCELVHLWDKPDNCSMHSYACYKGAKRADHNILVFMDANLLPTKELFQKLTNALRRHTAISVYPYEKFSSALGGLGGVRALCRLMLMGSFALPKKEDWGLIGEFVMIDRHDYFNVCTHDMVGADCCDSIALGQAYQKAGIRLRNYIGGASLCRFSPKQFKEPSNPASLFSHSPDGQSLFCIAVFLLGGFDIFVCFLRSIILMEGRVVWTWFYLAYGMINFYYLRKMAGEYHPLWIVGYPFQIFYTLAAFISGGVKTLKRGKLRIRRRKGKKEAEAGKGFNL